MPHSTPRHATLIFPWPPAPEFSSCCQPFVRERRRLDVGRCSRRGTEGQGSSSKETCPSPPLLLLIALSELTPLPFQLAQRQKAKANAVVSSSIAPSSPSLTINDALTVPLVRTSLSLDDNSREALEEKSIPNDLANRTPGAASPRPPPPPIVPSSPAPSSNQQSPPLDSSSNLRQTVSLLIAERSDLQSQITILQASLSSARGDSQLLAEGRTLIVQLEGEKRDLESRLGELDERAKKAEEGVAELGTVRNEVDGLRKERDNLTRQRDGAEEGRKEKEDGERERMKELERAREREGGLEAEVGRLRHVSGPEVSALR